MFWVIATYCTMITCNASIDTNRVFATEAACKKAIENALTDKKDNFRGFHAECKTTDEVKLSSGGSFTTGR